MEGEVKIQGRLGGRGRGEREIERRNIAGPQKSAAARVCTWLRPSPSSRLAHIYHIPYIIQSTYMIYVDCVSAHLQAATDDADAKYALHAAEAQLHAQTKQQQEDADLRDALDLRHARCVRRAWHAGPRGTVCVLFLILTPPDRSFSLAPRLRLGLLAPAIPAHLPPSLTFALPPPPLSCTFCRSIALLLCPPPLVSTPFTFPKCAIAH
eukprot:352952-Chlamydomonas_euryale.AAC.14